MNAICPRTASTRRMIRWRWAASPVRGGGMKSCTSPTLGHQEAGDEDIGIGKVELLGAGAVDFGRDAEPTAAVGVEDRGEDARRVEPRAAVPVNRPVSPDERDGVQITDQAMLGDRQVARPLCLSNTSRRDPPYSTGDDVESHQWVSSLLTG